MGDDPTGTRQFASACSSQRRFHRSLSEIASVGWLGLGWHARRCRNVRIALLFGASLRLDPAIRSTSPSSVAYPRQAPRSEAGFMSGASHDERTEVGAPPVDDDTERGL